jgi:hypothetical protein
MTETQTIARAMLDVLECSGQISFDIDDPQKLDEDLFRAFVVGKDAMLKHRARYQRPIEVKAGQVWEDNDARRGASGRGPRRGTILRVVKMGNSKDFAAVKWDTGRVTEVSLKRFRPTSTGYRLVSDAK